MNSNSTDQGLIVAGSPEENTSLKSGVASVTLVRDVEFDRVYRTSVYRPSLGLPAEMDVVIRNDDLSFNGRVSDQAGCFSVHAEFVATADSVELWQAVFNEQDGVARSIVSAMVQAEDAEPERAPIPRVQAQPAAQAREPATPSPAAPMTPQEREASYTLRDAIEDAHKISEIGKNIIDIWRGLHGTTDK